MTFCWRVVSWTVAGGEQTLGGGGAVAALCENLFKDDALVGGVLVDEIHAVRTLGDDVCEADLADGAEGELGGWGAAGESGARFPPSRE